MLWFNVKPFSFQLIHIIYIAIALYLFCGLLRYFLLQNCKDQKCIINCCKTAYSKQISSSSSNDAKSQDSRRSMKRQKSRERRQRNAKFVRIASALMTILSLAAGAVTFVHIFLDLWVFSVTTRFSISMLCMRQKWAGILFFSSSLFVYLFLWIRQRVFYSHPVLRNLSKPILNRFSWSVLFAIIFSITTFSIAYYIKPGDFLSNEKLDDLEYFIFYNASTWKVFSMRRNNANSEHKQDSTVVANSNYTCTFKSKNLYLFSHLVLTVTFLYFQQFIGRQKVSFVVFCLMLVRQRMPLLISFNSVSTILLQFTSKIIAHISHNTYVGISNNEKISLQILFAYPVLKGRRKRKRLLLQYDLNDKKSRKSCKRLSEPKTSEVFLTVADTPSNSSAPHSCVISTSAKRKTSTKSLHISRDSFKLSTLPSTALRSSQSESSLKTMSTKPKQVDRKNEISSPPKQLSVTEPDNRISQRLLSYSSSDSKLFSPSESAKPHRYKKRSSKFGCVAGSQKKKAFQKTQVCRYIWRCFFVTLVCCFTDIATFGYNVYTQISSSHWHSPFHPNSIYESSNTLHFVDHDTIKETNHTFNQFEERVTISLLTVMAFNGNMIINLVCMILCYDKFLEMLLPCFTFNRSASTSTKSNE